MSDRLHNQPRLKAVRRDLRAHATPAEKAVWGLLKGRALGGMKFRRQHSVGPLVLDSYCPEARLAIELDGGVHDGPARRAHDAERQAWLEGRGVQVLRLSNRTVFEAPDAVAAWIAEHLSISNRQNPPPPSPPVQEGG